MSKMLTLGCGNVGSSYLLRDLFAGADGTNLTSHAMDVGPGWTAGAGAITLSGNKATGNASGNYWADSAQANVTASLDVVLSTGVAGDLILRATDNNNFWLLEPYNDAFVLYEKNAGSFTIRASTAVSTAGSHTIQAVCSGSTIAATFDGGNQISYGSATFNQTATRHGISDGGVSNTAMDNFQVTL